MKHFMTLYKDYTSKSAENSKICSNKVEDMKQTFQSHQATVSNLINKAKDANTVLYGITEIMAKKKHVADGDMIKKCLVLASNSLLNKSKNATSTCTANHWPSSTINTRMECMSSDMIFN
jgi:hypothetical protein